MRSFRFAAAGVATLALLSGITAAAFCGATKVSAQIPNQGTLPNACDRLGNHYTPFCPPPNDPCDPRNAGYQVNQFTAQLTQQECAEQHQRTLQAQIEEQQRQAAQLQAQEAANRRHTEQQKAIAKAVTRGYRLISSVKDLILDGKDLANRNAKIQISGIYKKVGAGERLYATVFDAYQGTDIYVPVLSEDAQRPVREYLLSPTCRSQFGGAGCQISVGGRMTKCHFLAAEFASYPEVPCLNIEVQIIYRPGD